MGERRDAILELVKRLLEGRKVLALFSHGHRDHYGRGLVKATEDAESLTVVASHDTVRSEKGFLREVSDVLVVARPHETYSLEKAEVRTFENTDMGVAYVVKLGGLSVYHSGDLARWVWPDLPHRLREAVDRLFRKEVEYVTSEGEDVVIVVAEPRLPGWGGVDYFIEKVSPAYLVPAHLRGEVMLARKIKLEMQGLYPSTYFVTYTKEGEEILSLPLMY